MRIHHRAFDGNFLKVQVANWQKLNVCLTFSRNISSNLNNTQKSGPPETLSLGYLKIEGRSIVQNILYETFSGESSKIAVEHTETCNITFHDHIQFRS